jgi:hypothetical protein
MASSRTIKMPTDSFGAKTTPEREPLGGDGEITTVAG